MKNRPGFTLLETTIALSILLLVLTGASLLTIGAARSFDRTSAVLDADQSAANAVQQMMLDLEEAKQVTVLSATSLRVYFPQKAADGTYIRSALDSTNTLDFYRGNSDGTANASGDSLIRKPAGSTARVVCPGVSNLQFTSTNPSSVDIQLRTSRATYYGLAERDMVHRAIFLRNY